jgi:hypothetical protein
MVFSWPWKQHHVAQFQLSWCPEDGAAGDYFTRPRSSTSPTASASTFWVHGITNREYDILATNSVTVSNWPIVTRVTLTNSPQLWTDPNGEPSNGERFYRSRLVP